MLKGLIWFNDINLYNKCETEARKQGLTGANDFIVQSTENYIERNNAKYAPQEILNKKTGEKKLQKFCKNNLDMWICVKDQADKEKLTVAELMERICRDLLTPKTEEVTPVNTPEPPKKVGIVEKFSDALSLPRG